MVSDVDGVHGKYINMFCELVNFIFQCYYKSMIDPVKELRDLVGYDIPAYQIAKDIGITPGYLSMVMSGARPPGPKVLKYLGLKVEKLIVVKYRRVNGKVKGAS